MNRPVGVVFCFVYSIVGYNSGFKRPLGGRMIVLKGFLGQIVGLKMRLRVDVCLTYFDLFKIYPEWSGMVSGPSKTL